jgi:hypothetical protein
MTELEFRAHRFLRQHLSFLDRNWLSDVLDRRLGELLTQVVKEHTATGDNTAVLRAAVVNAAEWAEAILQRLPSEAKSCRCKELGSGEHAPQPTCHYCMLKALGPDMRQTLTHVAGGT